MEGGNLLESMPADGCSLGAMLRGPQFDIRLDFTCLFANHYEQLFILSRLRAPETKKKLAAFGPAMKHRAAVLTVAPCSSLWRPAAIYPAQVTPEASPYVI